MQMQSSLCSLHYTYRELCFLKVQALKALGVHNRIFLLFRQLYTLYPHWDFLFLQSSSQIPELSIMQTADSTSFAQSLEQTSLLTDLQNSVILTLPWRRCRGVEQDDLYDPLQPKPWHNSMNKYFLEFRLLSPYASSVSYGSLHECANLHLCS